MCVPIDDVRLESACVKSAVRSGEKDERTADCRPRAFIRSRRNAKNEALTEKEKNPQLRARKKNPQFFPRRHSRSLITLQGFAQITIRRTRTRTKHQDMKGFDTTSKKVDAENGGCAVVVVGRASNKRKTATTTCTEREDKKDRNRKRRDTEKKRACLRKKCRSEESAGCDEADAAATTTQTAKKKIRSTLFCVVPRSLNVTTPLRKVESMVVLAEESDNEDNVCDNNNNNNNNNNNSEITQELWSDEDVSPSSPPCVVNTTESHGASLALLFIHGKKADRINAFGKRVGPAGRGREKAKNRLELKTQKKEVVKARRAANKASTLRLDRDRRSKRAACCELEDEEEEMQSVHATSRRTSVATEATHAVKMLAAATQASTPSEVLELDVCQAVWPCEDDDEDEDNHGVHKSHCTLLRPSPPSSRADTTVFTHGLFVHSKKADRINAFSKRVGPAGRGREKVKNRSELQTQKKEVVKARRAANKVSTLRLDRDRRSKAACRELEEEEELVGQAGRAGGSASATVSCISPANSPNVSSEEAVEASAAAGLVEDDEDAPCPCAHMTYDGLSLFFRKSGNNRDERRKLAATVSKKAWARAKVEERYDHKRQKRAMEKFLERKAAEKHVSKTRRRCW